MTHKGFIMTSNNGMILDSEAAAAYLGVSTTVLKRLTRSGYIAYVEFPSSGKVGRASRKWTKADLDEFVASRRRKAPAREAAAPTARGKARAKHNADTFKSELSAAEVLKDLEA